MYVYMGVHVCVRMHVWVFSMHLYILVCLVACYSISSSFGEIRISCRRPGHDSDSYRCGPDTEGIRRPMHRMIRRSVPVHAVKTRRRFGSETSSFHVSVRSCVFIVIDMLYMLPLSFYVTFRYTLLVWLLVPVHETYMIVHFIHVDDFCLY